MLDYSKAKIYKLVCDDGFYIGSTCRELRVRFSEHRRHRTGPRRTKACDLTINDNTRMELLLDYPCTNKLQLDLMEANFILANPGCINQVIPRRNYKPHLAKYQAVQCELCDNVLARGSLNRHIASFHLE